MLIEHFKEVQIKIEGVLKTIIHGVNEIKRKIILLMGETIAHIYLVGETLNSEVGGSSSYIIIIVIDGH